MRRFAVVILLLTLGAARGKPVVVWGIEHFLKTGEKIPLADIYDAIPDAFVDIRYATNNNITGKKLYSVPLCFVRKELLHPLAEADNELRKHGFRLLFWDCYRPYKFQKILYEEATKKGLQKLFANPRYGSNHNRGVAVDVSLVSLDGKSVPMPTDFDALVPESVSNAPLANKEAERNRELLKKVMRKHGFRTIRKEWWHFNYRNAKSFPLLDVPLDYLANLRKK